jgi:hypothetical protein
MNITDSTARKLASADRAAADLRLTHQDFRLLWLLLSAADRKTGIARRKQRELAKALDCTERGVQISRDRLVSLGYLGPIGVKPGGYVSSYNVLIAEKANAGSASEKGERRFASENKKANGGGQKGERPFQKGEAPFVHDPLISLDIPSAPNGETEHHGPRRAEGALGPLGALEPDLRRRLGENFKRLSMARLVARTADTVTLSVLTAYQRDEIRKHCEGDILAAAGATKLEFAVEIEAAPLSLRRMP